MKRSTSSLCWCASATLVLIVGALLTPSLRGNDTPFTGWTDTDDSRGIQYRYQVINPDSQSAKCVVQFRDLRPEASKASPSSTGDTDVEFRYDFVTPRGSDDHDGGRTRIWNVLGDYGAHNILLCKRVSSVVVTKLYRGR